jgi:hypothetical protein
MLIYRGTSRPVSGLVRYPRVNSLQKEGLTLGESDFNKTLLDLEIYGLVRVSWITKDKRRIELVAESKNPS